MKNAIEQHFNIPFDYDVHFTRHLFSRENDLITNIVHQHSEDKESKKILIVIDQGVADSHPTLINNIKEYFQYYAGKITLPVEPILVPGGEVVKNSFEYVDRLLEAVNECGLDRQSYMAAIGGGAVLDMVGFVAGIAHRGIRHIRIPTTVLSQNDSGVGVKNGINYFGKKNFIGTFAPPFSVINDVTFLSTLNDRDWRGGIAEGIKVALIKDEAFFNDIEQDAPELVARNPEVMEKLIYKCAELHVNHIGQGGDPFETGSSRPLDFGHWAGHKLEQLTHYNLRHGEAVAIGIALDVTYAWLADMLDEASWKRILQLLHNLGFTLFTPELKKFQDDPHHPQSLLKGLDEFREHLGGELTIMLLNKIGQGVEVHEMDHALIKNAIDKLEEYCER